MTVEPWDANKKYKAGDHALVKDEECVVVSHRRDVCEQCPHYDPYGYNVNAAPNGCLGCGWSIGPHSGWCRVEVAALLRLKGEI